MKRKLLFLATLVVSALGMRAQNVPVFQELNDFNGTTVSSLTTFVPNGTTYTLELTGCTAGTEITVPGGSFSYTPTASGTVRFIRYGNSVYVYEGTSYKTALEVSTPTAPTYPTELTSASTENLIQNGGFEDLTDGLFSGKTDRWKPTHWKPYTKDKVASGDGTSVRKYNSIEGSYAMLMHDYGEGFYLTQQLASGVMNNFTPYQISFKFIANTNDQKGAKYKFQVGNAEFNTDYYSSEETSASTTSIQTFTKTFVTPATVVDQPYVQIFRSTDTNVANLDYFDAIILVAANGGGIGITGATGATFLSGKAYAPEGVLAAEVADERYGNATMRITNPTFDTNLTGWNSPIGGGSEIKVADNRPDQTRYFYQTWNGTPKEGRMYQVIENLPSGTYELEMIAFADQAGTMTAANTTVAVYAQGQEVGTTSSPYIRPNYVNNVNFTSYKAYAYVDETGKLEIGMRQYSPAEFRWLGMDNVTLKYIATDNQEEAKMLDLYKNKWIATKDALNTELNDATYNNITGEERTGFRNSIADEVVVSSLTDYKTLADNAKGTRATFVNAKGSYDGLIAKRTEAAGYTTEAWPYASTDKKTAIDNAVATNDPTNAADAVTKTNAITTAIRQFVESNGVAEGVAVAVSYASAIAGADPDTNTGWTGGIGVDDRSQEKYTDGSGNASGKYYDGGWATNAGVNITMTRTLTLPAGQYLLQVTARGSENLTTYTMSVGSVSVDLPKQGSGANVGTFGHGWSDKYVVFTSDGTDLTLTFAATSTDYYQWISFNRLRLVKLDATLATAQDYENLNNAIAAAEAKLGFENGQNAPYNNVASMELLAAAKAIDQTINNVQGDVQDATTALTGATWTANSADVDAIYNQDFSEGGWEPTAWTSTGWAAKVNDINTNSVISKTGKGWRPNPGTISYGNTGVYTMPLAGNQVYKLTFKYGAWDGWTIPTISVLNADDGLAATALAGTNTNYKTAMTSQTMYFKTGAAGNYILSMNATYNMVYTDVSLVKADESEILMAETATTAPANGYYQTMNTSRTLVGDKWNGFSLPFSLTSEQIAASALNGATIKQVASVTDNVITLETTDVIVAGKPYLVKPASNVENPTFNGVIVNNPTETVEGTGNYTFQAHLYYTDLDTNGSVAYVSTGEDNSIKKLTSGGIKGLRAIFNIPTGAGVKPLNVNFGDDTTGILLIDAEGNITEGAIYNLAGQRVNKVQKGIYIQNGKKIYVK